MFQDTKAMYKIISLSSSPPHLPLSLSLFLSLAFPLSYFSLFLSLPLSLSAINFCVNILQHKMFAFSLLSSFCPPFPVPIHLYFLSRDHC